VGVGQSVSKGQKIGSVGGSGYIAKDKYADNAYGPHLHFGAIANADDACVDPEIWIDFHNPYSNAN
jgi:Peptidase family M23.